MASIGMCLYLVLVPPSSEYLVPGTWYKYRYWRISFEQSYSYSSTTAVVPLYADRYRLLGLRKLFEGEIHSLLEKHLDTLTLYTLYSDKVIACMRIASFPSIVDNLR